MENRLKFTLDDNAPEGQFTKAHDSDAGFDIMAAESFWLPRGASWPVSTGLHVAIPEGYVGLVKSRSGMAFNSCIEAGAGVIDSGYRGEIKVLLHNLGGLNLEIKRGDRIAQMLVLPLCEYGTEQVPVGALPEGERGENGFGSTGA